MKTKFSLDDKKTKIFETAMMLGPNKRLVVAAEEFNDWIKKKNNKDRCPECDCVLATDEDFEKYKEGEGTHLCWREWSNDVCRNDHVDWRERALKAEKMIEEKFDDFVVSGDGGLFCIEEDMLAYLLHKGVVFLNSRNYVDVVSGEVEPETIVVFVDCSDLWYFASADAIEITYDELPELTRMYLEDKKWGVIKWVCRKKNMRPQRPIRDHMKGAGAWDDMMEGLNSNPDEVRDGNE